MLESYDIFYERPRDFRRTFIASIIRDTPGPVYINTRYSLYREHTNFVIYLKNILRDIRTYFLDLFAC